MGVLLDAIPIEFRSKKCCRLIRIRNLGLRFRRTKLLEAGEFRATPTFYFLCQFRSEITEEQKRRLSSEFLSHKQQWRRRREQQNRNCRSQATGISDTCDALS